MSWEHQTTLVNGVRLHYVSAGSGPLVLLLHGFPDFWYSWRYQIPALAADFQVVALDLRGYNRSEVRGPYDIPTLVADITELIDQLGGRASLVGHDWGGAIAWFTAGWHPERVERLAALNIPHPSIARRHLQTNPRQMLRSWYIAFFQIPRLPELCLRARDYRLPLRGLALNAAPGAVSRDDLARYREAFRRSGLHGGVEYYRAAARLGFRRELWQALAVNVPTLHIWGARDPALGRELLLGTERYVADYQQRVVRWAGHWVHTDAAELVNQYLRAFLRGEAIPA